MGHFLLPLWSASVKAPATVWAIMMMESLLNGSFSDIALFPCWKGSLICYQLVSDENVDLVLFSFLLLFVQLFYFEKKIFKKWSTFVELLIWPSGNCFLNLRLNREYMIEILEHCLQCWFLCLIILCKTLCEDIFSILEDILHFRFFAFLWL